MTIEDFLKSRQLYSTQTEKEYDAKETWRLFQKKKMDETRNLKLNLIQKVGASAPSTTGSFQMSTLDDEV